MLRVGGMTLSLKENTQLSHSNIKLTVIIIYYSELFERFPLGRMSFHQLFASYYRDFGVAVSIKEFHSVKDIILE